MLRAASAVREFDFGRGVVFERVEIDRMDLFFLSYAFIKALTGFFTQPAALRHPGVELGHEEALAPRIRGDCVI